MEKEIIKHHAMIITIGRKGWNCPKNVLIETDGKPDERLDDIAKRAFNKYKVSRKDDALYLLTYYNFGNIEIFD